MQNDDFIKCARLTLAVPGLVGHTARKALARLNDEAGNPLPEAFWHYRDGYPIPDRMPAIRIGGSTRHVWVAGMGDEGSLLLYDNVGAITRLFTRHCGHFPQASLQEWETRCDWNPYLKRYRIHNVAMNLHESLREKIRNNDIGSVEEHLLIEKLEEAFMRVTHEYLPAAPAVVIRSLRVDKSVGIPQKAGVFRQAITGEIEVLASLKGHWQIGSLMSRGYGRVTPVTDSRDSS